MIVFCLVDGKMVIIMCIYLIYNMVHCSGDFDGRVPVTSTKYSIDTMNLPVKKSWYPWFIVDEVLSYSISPPKFYPQISTLLKFLLHINLALCSKSSHVSNLVLMIKTCKMVRTEMNIV